MSRSGARQPANESVMHLRRARRKAEARARNMHGVGIHEQGLLPRCKTFAEKINSLDLMNIELHKASGLLLIEDWKPAELRKSPSLCSNERSYLLHRT